MRMRAGERGASLPESLLILLFLSLCVLAVGNYSLGWLNAEDVRSAVGQTQRLVQQARIEAIARNRACRFILDTAARRVQVVDLNDPTDATDDITLSDVALSSKVSFGDPSGNPAVTLASLGGGRYQATFASDGTVSAGIGVMSFQAKTGYRRLSLFGAGGNKLENWNGSAWQVGS